MPPIEQIRLIQKDRLIEERENQRRSNINQVPKSNANQIPRLKFTSNTNATLDSTSSKNQR